MFLVSNWIVYSKFMDLNNSFEILVYYFLIKEMTDFGSYGEYTNMYGYTLDKT